MTRPDPDSDPEDSTVDCDPTADHSSPYPRRERFSSRLAVYEDDRGTVAVIDDPEQRGAWLLSTRFVAVER